MAVIVFGPLLFFQGCLFVSIGTVVLSDRLSGKPLLLEQSVIEKSPDGKFTFVAETNGRLLLRDARNNILHTAQVSTGDYKGITAEWVDDTSLKLRLHIRYPVMALAVEKRFDARSGKLEDVSY